MLFRLFRFFLPLGLFALFLAVAAFVFAWFTLPRVEQMKWGQDQPTITLLDRNGDKITTYGDAFGTFYAVPQLPPYLVQAVLATEDRRFYRHYGIDPRGFARAVYTNIRRGRLVQGGSTITQQLAKNLYFSGDRSLSRKLREAVMAIKLENKFTKDQLLSLYLNRVYFGAGTYGVDAASQRFFGKTALELDLYESATLAGLLKAPARYNPANSLEQAEGRTKIVIRAMQAAGYIDAGLADSLIRRGRATLETGQARVGRSKAPYFADWIMSQLDGYIGTPKTDLVVHTTLDTGFQAKARAALYQKIRQAAPERRVTQGALVSLDGDGAVQALVGGGSYKTSQFNRATQALRQPGSAFKLFVYLAALEQGMALNTPVYDGPVNIADWTPQNYSRKFYGEVKLETAFQKSLNPASVVLAETAGRKNVKNMAYRLGISTRLTDHPSLSLGASEGSLLELTGAYTIVANGGKHIVPHGIERIENSAGQVLYRRQLRSHQAISKTIADKMRYLLASVVRSGTGKRANRDGVLGGKTGTSSNNRDAVFVGYTNSHVTGVWVGNDSGKAMEKVTGGSLPVDIFLAAQGLDAKPANRKPLVRPNRSLNAENAGIFSEGIY